MSEIGSRVMLHISLDKIVQLSVAQAIPRAQPRYGIGEMRGRSLGTRYEDWQECYSHLAMTPPQTRPCGCGCGREVAAPTTAGYDVRLVISCQKWKEASTWASGMKLSKHLGCDFRPEVVAEHDHRSGQGQYPRQAFEGASSTGSGEYSEMQCQNKKDARIGKRDE